MNKGDKSKSFKRNLPFCTFLLNDAVKGLNIELKKCRRRNTNALEEFMPARSSKS